jgi:hypothetical protein
MVLSDVNDCARARRACRYTTLESRRVSSKTPAGSLGGNMPLIIEGNAAFNLTAALLCAPARQQSSCPG